MRSAAQDYDDAVMALAPAGYWKLEEVYADTTFDVIDSSGNARNGTYTGGSSGSIGTGEFLGGSRSMFCNGIQHANITDFAAASSHAGASGVWTICGWFYLDVTLDATRYLWSKENSSGGQYEGHARFTTAGTGRITTTWSQITTGTVAATSQSGDVGGTAWAEEWHHYAFIFDRAGGVYTTMIDGAVFHAAGSGAYVGGVFTSDSTAPLRIGAGPSAGTPWPGSMARWSLHDVALTTAQITALYEAMFPASVPIALVYPLTAEGLLPLLPLDIATPPPETPTVLTDLVMAPALVAPQALPPDVTFDAAAALLPLTTRALRFPDLDPVADLADAKRRRILDPYNEVGSGSLVLHNTDPDLDALQPLDAIQVVLYGEVIFAFLAEEFAPVLLEDGEESGYETTVSGRSVTALPSWCRIYPGNGIEAHPIEVDRLFSWPAPQFQEIGWSAALEVGDATGLVRVPGTQVGYPEGAPDEVAAKWIWGPPGTDSFAPGGSVYARKTITIADTGDYLFGWAFDNYGVIYIDGQLLGQLDRTGGPANYLTVHTRTVQLTAGEHTIAIRATNIAPSVQPGGGADNPGGIYCIVGTISEDGSFYDLVDWTDSSWSLLAYPPYPPGMTPGEMIRICMDEAQARGVLDWVTLSFSDAVDSAGAAWPVVGDVATKTGNDLLTFMGELSGTYIDYWVSPGDFVLHAWVKGTRGVATGVAIGPATGEDADTGNLRGLTTRQA